MEQVILTSSANTGIGLWTCICVMFSQIFGLQSNSYKYKQEKILDFANKELKEQLLSLGGGFVLKDYRVTWSGKLSVTVSGVAVREKAPQKKKENTLKLEPAEEIKPAPTTDHVEEQKSKIPTEVETEKFLEKVELSDEKLLEILKENLNVLNSNGTFVDVTNNLRSWKDERTDEIAKIIESVRNNPGAVNVLKKATKDLQ